MFVLVQIFKFFSLLRQRSQVGRIWTQFYEECSRSGYRGSNKCVHLLGCVSLYCKLTLINELFTTTCCIRRMLEVRHSSVRDLGVLHVSSCAGTTCAKRWEGRDTTVIGVPPLISFCPLMHLSFVKKNKSR